MGWSDLSIPCQKFHVRYYNTLTITCCLCEQRSKHHKNIIQTFIASTRSSDYVAIGGGSNGISGGSESSRWLARVPPPGGKEEEDNDSTPVAFDVDDSNGGKVEVNGECKGNGNSDGNNDNNDYDVNNDKNNDNGGGAGQKHKHGTIVEEREEMEVVKCQKSG